MKRVLPLFIFIDACGWEIVRSDPFGQRFAPHRRRLASVFGYSSACVPSIVSGRWPADHRNWCYFVYDPSHSPFRSLRWLQWLPAALTSRRTFRRFLSRFIKSRLSFRGYFDLYNIPFQHISLYDFTEKKSPLQPGGLNQGLNVFDHLERNHILYHVSDPARTEEQNLEVLVQDICAEQTDFAFLYWPGLDGLLHRVGNQSPEIGAKLRLYENWIERLLAVVKQHYDQTNLYVFSDHGMANCETCLDLRSKIDALPVRMGSDYAAVYDSTMARFWFFNDFARQQIVHGLSQVAQGRIIPDNELEAMHVLFPDRYFGELIFLVQEGVLIVPSHMGERPIRGMHGYHPKDKHSYALLCSNLPEIPDDVVAIPDLFRLMISEAMGAKKDNSCSLGHPGSRTKLRHSPKAVCSEKPLLSQTVLSRSGTSLG